MKPIISFCDNQYRKTPDYQEKMGGSDALSYDQVHFGSIGRAVHQDE